MNDFMYLVKLPKKVDGVYTHIAVREEIRDHGWVKCTGLYGRVLASGFVPNSFKQDGQLVIRAGDEREDFVEQVRAVAGRPPEKPDHEFMSEDLQAYFESDPAVRQERIKARKAAEEAAAE